MRARLPGFVGLVSLLTSAAAMLSSCNPMEKKTEPARKWEMFAAEQLAHWRSADMPDGGKAEVRDGEAVISPGGPMSGLRFDNWERGGLPLREYTISYEAMRVDGGDFFASLTFPVRNIETCATLIVGGWGGGLVGISSIDGEDASNNSTRSEQNFENGKWYRLKLEVRDDEIKAWIDARIVINTSIKNRVIGLRPGYIEKCAPFGLATFGSTGRVRNLVVEEMR